MKIHNILSLAATLLLTATGVMAQIPSGYYDSLEGKKGDELKNAVKQIGKKGFKAIDYKNGTWEAFKSTDVRHIDGKDCWWDMYSSNNVAVSSGHPGMNVEHSVANSWWGGTNNNAYKDIVHLNPSNSDANSRKSNYPIGEIATVKWDNGITFVGSPKSGQGGGCTQVYEPHDMYKGDFARVFMYMFTIYDDISWQNATSNTGDGRGRMYTYTGGVAVLQPWAYNLMLSWNAADPVSEKEINRNNGIQKEQGNRNPFIDLPDLGDYIWGSKKNEVYHVDTSHIPEPGENPEEPENPSDPEPVLPELEGKYILVENQSDIEDGGEYLILSPSKSLALSGTTRSSSSMAPTGTAEIADKVIAKAPENSAHVKLEKATEGYYLHLHDLSGNSLGYLVSPKAKDLHIADTPEETGSEATISVSPSKTTISYGTSGYLQYNSSATMWRTYSSGQEDPVLYKFQPVEITSAVSTPTEEENFSVIIRGNSIEATEGSVIFDLSGRRVNGDNLQQGVYIIVSPQKTKTVKAIVNL